MNYGVKLAHYPRGENTIHDQRQAQKQARFFLLFTIPSKRYNLVLEKSFSRLKPVTSTDSNYTASEGKI